MIEQNFVFYSIEPIHSLCDYKNNFMQVFVELRVDFLTAMLEHFTSPLSDFITKLYNSDQII